MEEAFSVKEQDFTIIKEKIIKTNDLIVLYKEANDKLTKSKSRANQAIRQLKEKNEALTQEVRTLKFHNERLTDNIERYKADVKDLELTNLNDEYVKIQKKYQQHLIESQLTITDLERKITQCSCETNETPWPSSRKVTAHDKVRELKVLCNEFKGTEQKLKSEINNLNKKNFSLEEKILILGSPKTPGRKSKEWCATKAKLQDAEALIENQEQTINSLKQQHSKEVSLLQEQLNFLILDNDKLKCLEEKCKSLEEELFKLQRMEKSDVYTQTENAPIGRCEDNSDVDDEDLKDIFSEMICYELMLSPMSGSGQSLSDQVAPIAATTKEILKNEIPNIIVTPPTPGIDIKEGSLALHALMQTTITNAIPPDHYLNEMPIDFGDELRTNNGQVKNLITIPVSLEGSPENTSNKMAVYFGNDLKIVDGEVGSQINSIPKQKKPKRSIKSDRHRKKFWMPYPIDIPLKTKCKNRPRDTILNAIQILQKNNINFTITNESPYNRLPPVKVEPVAPTKPKHKTNSNTAVKCATPVVKRKRGRPPKIKTETDASDKSFERVCKSVVKNKRIISKEFITDDESDSDDQQNVNFRKVSVLSEKNTNSDQDCIKSKLTIENCGPNNQGVNKTDSRTIDPETQPPTNWPENLILKQDTLCDSTELKEFSKNNFENFKTKYKEKAKKVAKKRLPQDKLSQTLLDVPKHIVEEEDFRGFDDCEKEVANLLRLTVFRQNMKLVRQICEKSNELNSLHCTKNVQTYDNRINIVQDILITKQKAIDLISGTTVPNSQRTRVRKSISPKRNTSVDILSQVLEEMTKTGPAQKARKMFIKPAPVYTPAFYSTSAKRKAEEVEEVRETSNEGDELFEDSPRSPDAEVIPDQAPKLIPTQKPQQMRVQKVASAINKLLSFGHETAMVDEIAMKFAFQTNYFIAQVVVGKISQNCDKPDNSFPPSPPMSSVQRILLGFLIKLEKSTHPGVLDKVLELIEPQVFNRLVCTIEHAQQLTRFYTAICRMRQDLHRMRRFICDSFYFSGDFAVPVLFTALTMWPNVLPMASQLSEFPLAKVIVHICYLKLCNKPGYNLMPLRDLLSRFYGYPTERWNCDELFQEILVDYIRNPSVKLSDYTLQLFLKNKPASWVSKKVHDSLIPLYQQVPDTNPNLKATLLILYGNIHYFFKAHELQFVTKIDEWFEGLQQEEKDPVVQRSLIVARQRLLKCRIGSARKRNKEPDPNKALQVIEANVDNSKVQ